MKFMLGALELDTSIQCRAAIDRKVVGEYAERMRAGDDFPPIDVFGSKKKAWIGDGWHRMLAAKQVGSESIAAILHEGGRVDALKHALGANALHGHRRTNADKRRCVEIALSEFPKLSSRAIAKMCGVSHELVQQMRPDQVSTVDTPPRTGQDGKQYPAKREPDETQQPDELDASSEQTTCLPDIGPPANGMYCARMALMDLEQIQDDDVERDAAFDCVLDWIQEKRGVSVVTRTREAEAAIHS